MHTFTTKEQADSVYNTIHNMPVKVDSNQWSYKSIGVTKPKLEKRKKKNRLKEKNRRKSNRKGR